MKHKHWTVDDIERLKELQSAHMTYSEIATAMGRTHYSIKGAVEKYILHKGSLRIVKKKTPRREHYIGCNHDCFRCPYSDCIAPPSIAAVGISSKDYLE